MLKVLLKKQFAEVFRGYFYDAKKNKMRSKGSIVTYFILFTLLMVGMLGGIFTALSFTLVGLSDLGVGWMYFLILGTIAILLGAFGSVFNTYSALYLAKDNDLLLSLPIPVGTIMVARLLNVYLLGTMYSATVLLPALIVYWLYAGPTVPRILCGIVFFVVVTGTVLLLSCLLGWVVAKISLRLKNKSFITVIISLLFIIGYYVFYFRAQGIISDLLTNALSYGTKIKGSAYVLYLFGRIGEGSWQAALIFLAAFVVLFALLWHFMSRSFIGIATSSGAVAKVRYVEKTAKQQSAFRALIGKELARFTSSATYMLNSGLGMLLIPAAGIAMLLKGRVVWEAVNEVFAVRPGTGVVLICAMLCMLTSMNNMTVPSVSLEGKSIWIPQSLPVVAKQVLRAKIAMQLVLTLPVMLFATICVAVSSRASVPQMLLIVLIPLIYTVFSAVLGLFMGVKMPIMNWTNEMTPIKQSGAVVIVMFGSWAICIAFGGLYLLAGYRLGAELYLFLWAAVFTAVTALLMKWLDTRGARKFEEL